MVSEHVIIKEVIAYDKQDTLDVHSSIRCSGVVFKELFGTAYPSGLSVGDSVAKVPFGNNELELFYSQVVGWEGTARYEGYCMPVTNGSWTLWNLLSQKGFKLIDSRTYEKISKTETNFDGKCLQERVFARDL